MSKSRLMNTNAPWVRKRSAKPEVASAKDLLDHARQFLRLDLAYVVALGAAITVLQLNGRDLLDIANEWKQVAQTYAYLLLFDSALYAWLFALWVGLPGVASFTPYRLHRWFMVAQPIAHAFFIVATVTGAAAYAGGMGSAYAEYDAMADVQSRVELFIAQHGRVPAAVGELGGSVGLKRSLNVLGGASMIRIEGDPKRKYKITFALRDRVFGTDDDEVLDSTTDANATLEKMKRAN